MSTVSESKPWWAMTSAEKPVGIDSHPFTTASPVFQIAFSVFSLTSLSSWSRAELRPADRPEVAPAADAEVLGLLEVGEHRDVRLRVHEVRLHGAHRQPELLLDLGEEWQAEEVPETLGDVPAERLPGLGLQVDPVLVLEERRRLRIVAVTARLGGAPLTAHPLDDVADEGLHGDVAAVGEGVEGHLDRVVHRAARPLLPRRELLQDVEAADLLGGRRVPAAPRAVVVVEVLPLALLEGVVAAPRPGEIVRELRHRRH